MSKAYHGNKWMPVLHAHFYGILKEIAEEHGYALALHGTLGRDLDLIAVAWVEDAKPYIDLLNAMTTALGNATIDGAPHDFKIEQKPRGRIGAIIQGGGGGYIDISIMGVS